MTEKLIKVNLGCGPNPPSGWVNVDGSFNALLTKYKFIRKVLFFIGMISKKSLNIAWNKSVVYMNLNKRFKFKDSSIDIIYTSHLLEHIQKDRVDNFLNEIKRVLKPGGILRIVVPDFEVLVRDYIKHKETKCKGALEQFLLSLNMHRPVNRTFVERMYDYIWDFHTHKWMYDKETLYDLLDEKGFRDLKIFGWGVSGIENMTDLEKKEYYGSIYIEGIK